MPDGKCTSDSEQESLLSSSIEDENIRGKKPRKNKYKCSFEGCGLSFKRMTFLDRHEFTHTGIRKYSCQYENCNKSYKIDTHLKRHIKSFHEKCKTPRDLKCPIDNCNKYFTCNENVERHVKQIHEERRMYVCPSCPQEFHRKLQLRKHVIVHTGEHSLKCDSCLKKFIYPALFERHICKRKLYKCETCNDEFNKWSLLVKHRRNSHIPIYKCAECNKEFKTNSNLKKHLLIHKDAEEKLVYSCTWEGCSRFYHHSRNLRVHIKTKHEGQKFTCSREDCTKSFATKQKLQNHIHWHETGLKKVKKSKSGNRQKRADAGKMKTSFASILSGVVLDPQTEKLIKERENKEVTIDIESAIQNLLETTDTESDDTTVKKRIILHSTIA